MEVTKCPCDAMIQVQKDIRAHQDRLAAGDGNFRVIEVTLTTMSSTMDEVKQDVKSLVEKPAKRWDSLAEKIINWAVLGILAWAVSQLADKL